MPVSLFAATMAWCAGHMAGYPLGGSLKMAKDIEKRYLELGGKVFYGKRVAKITVKDGMATEITLEDGANIPADVVISAADYHSTLFGMLGDG